VYQAVHGPDLGAGRRVTGALQHPQQLVVATRRVTLGPGQVTGEGDRDQDLVGRVRHVGGGLLQHRPCLVRAAQLDQGRGAGGVRPRRWLVPGRLLGQPQRQVRIGVRDQLRGLQQAAAVARGAGVELPQRGEDDLRGMGRLARPGGQQGRGDAAPPGRRQPAPDLGAEHGMAEPQEQPAGSAAVGGVGPQQPSVLQPYDHVGGHDAFEYLHRQRCAQRDGAESVAGRRVEAVQLPVEQLRQGRRHHQRRLPPPEPGMPAQGPVRHAGPDQLGQVQGVAAGPLVQHLSGGRR
jgi:hypothetical protein